MDHLYARFGILLDTNINRFLGAFCIKHFVKGTITVFYIHDQRIYINYSDFCFVVETFTSANLTQHGCEIQQSLIGPCDQGFYCQSTSTNPVCM